MQTPLSGFAALHQLAAGRGDGLHPKLLELAQRDARLRDQGAIPLDVAPKSAGPAQQDLNQTSQADNVTVLPTAAGPGVSQKTG